MTAINEHEVDELVDFLKVLADKNRLRILGLLSDKEYTVRELAAALGVTEPTVSSHLNMLKWRGLVVMREQGTSHHYRLRQEGVHTLLKDLTYRANVESPEDPNSTEFERRVLHSFFKNGRLTEIPTRPSRRLVVLRRLAKEFRYGEFYTELQINETLKRFHDDVAALRRYMVDNRIMARKNGLYWRLDEAVTES
jgi:DNA-binding HxlR family transcriptional regulator